MTANHTSPLADPVLMYGKLPGYPRFLAAGSWWKYAPARLLFRMAGAVPIFRRRDGGAVDANDATFEACNEVLAEGATVALFPEGELHLEPSIAPLKTGAARIALGAAADAGVRDIRDAPGRHRLRGPWPLPVDGRDAGGTPVPVDPWVEQYRTEPREAVRGLTQEVTCGLRAVTVNHDTWDDLRLIDRAATLALADDRAPGYRYAVAQRAPALGSARRASGPRAATTRTGTRWPSGSPRTKPRSKRSASTSAARCRPRRDSPASVVASWSCSARSRRPRRSVRWRTRRWPS